MANPLLALEVQTPDIVGNFARGQAHGQEMQTARLGNVLANYKLQQAQAAEQRQNALSQVYQQHGPGLAQGEPEAVNALAKLDPEGAIKVRTDTAKANADTFKAMVDRAEFIGRTASGILSAPPAVRPLLYTRSLQQAKEMGIDVSGAPPQYDEAAVAAMRDQAVSVKDQLTIAQQKANAEETARHNRTSESIQVRGQNMVDARAKDNANAWRDLTAEEKKAKGLPKDSSYQVNAQTGKVERVAGNTSVRPIPSSALAGIQSNRRTLEKIHKAIEAIKKNPGALGLQNYAGDDVNQRMDPKGVPVRALVADIGSQKIHDRSGAAVTSSESPRLKPFVPLVTDRDEVAIQKLENLAAEYEASTDEAEAFYSPEAGYMSLPSRGDNSNPGNSGGKPVAGAVIDFNDLPDN